MVHLGIINDFRVSTTNQGVGSDHDTNFLYFPQSVNCYMDPEIFLSYWRQNIPFSDPSFHDKVYDLWILTRSVQTSFKTILNFIFPKVQGYGLRTHPQYVEPSTGCASQFSCHSKHITLWRSLGLWIVNPYTWNQDHDVRQIINFLN